MSSSSELKKKFKAELSSGKKLKITITQGEETIARKAKIHIGFRVNKDPSWGDVHRKEEELSVLRKSKSKVDAMSRSETSVVSGNMQTEVDEKIRNLRIEIIKATKELQVKAEKEGTPVYRSVKDENGNYVTYPQRVLGVRIKVEFDDEEILTARSCCKPPDVFKAVKGRKIALKRIFLLDKGINPATGATENKDRSKNPRFTAEDKIELRSIIRKDIKHDSVIKVSKSEKKKKRSK